MGCTLGVLPIAVDSALAKLSGKSNAATHKAYKLEKGHRHILA